MLAKLPEVVGQGRVAAGRHYLEGLWWSGLRLEESLNLYWDRADKLCVDLSGKRPMLRIPAELEKGHKDRLLPMAPEFAEFLSRTPGAERKGRVFKLLTRSGGMWLGPGRVGRIGVLREGCGRQGLYPPENREGEVRQPARPSPILRGAVVNAGHAQVLMELMRHESIQTTMGFYVGRNTQTTADAVWSAYGRNRGQNGATVGAIDEKTDPTNEAGSVVTSFQSTT